MRTGAEGRIGAPVVGGLPGVVVRRRRRDRPVRSAHDPRRNRRRDRAVVRPTLVESLNTRGMSFSGRRPKKRGREPDAVLALNAVGQPLGDESQAAFGGAIFHCLSHRRPSDQRVGGVMRQQARRSEHCDRYGPVRPPLVPSRASRGPSPVPDLRRHGARNTSRRQHMLPARPSSSSRRTSILP